MLGGLGILEVCLSLLRRRRSSFTLSALFTLPLITTWLFLASSGANSLSFAFSVFALETYHFGNLSYSETSTGSAVYIYLASTLSAIAVLYPIQYLGRRFNILGTNLLVIYPTTRDDAPKLDHGAVLSLLLFLATILASVLWYGYVYSPS